MLQVFRLVDPGRVDRVLAFDSLPVSMLTGIKRGPCNGLPSNWYVYLGVKRGDNNTQPFYVLDFRTLNKDKEKWQEINNYVRRSTDKNFRLLDNLYDMAKPMAPDSHSSLELDPDDVLVIPVLTDEEAIEEKVINKVEEIERKTDSVLAAPVKKRGRPKKVVEELPV